MFIKHKKQCLILLSIRNATQNHLEISPCTFRMATIKKKKKRTVVSGRDG